jgi:hypothetical protein
VTKKKERTPQEEEALAKKRSANAKKAAKKAAATRHAQKADRIWPEIKRVQEEQRCHCDLKKGMTLADLRKLNAGCTAPQWVCPVLIKYRALLGDKVPGDKP